MTEFPCCIKVIFEKAAELFLLLSLPPEAAYVRLNKSNLHLKKLRSFILSSYL